MESVGEGARAEVGGGGEKGSVMTDRAGIPFTSHVEMLSRDSRGRDLPSYGSIHHVESARQPFTTLLYSHCPEGISPNAPIPSLAVGAKRFWRRHGQNLAAITRSPVATGTKTRH